MDNQGLSVSECFKGNELIARGPDRMVSYFEGFIILAFRNNIFYLNVNDARIDEKESSDSIIEIAI